MFSLPLQYTSSFIYVLMHHIFVNRCLQRISLVIAWDKGNKKTLTLKDRADKNQAHCSIKTNVVNTV